MLTDFRLYLEQDEKARGTVEKYIRDVGAFLAWSEEINPEKAGEWKALLLREGYSPATINSKIASLNAYIKFLNLNIKVKPLKLQKKIFQEESKILTKSEYVKLIETAIKNKKERLALLMETICSTGIRVSEVKYITVEALKSGSSTISLKGKIRTILIPTKLCKKLLRYAQKQHIKSGEVFITKTGNSLSRKQVWAEMKAICHKAGIESTKVFPHSLRHLFARTFYKIYKDIAHLADVLGHSSIETTRIYLLSSSEKHQKEISRLGLII